MNNTILPAWVHTIALLGLSFYMFALWRAVKGGVLNDGQKRLLEKIRALRSPSLTMTVACLFLALAVGHAAWSFGLRW